MFYFIELNNNIIHNKYFVNLFSFSSLPWCWNLETCDEFFIIL